MSSVQRCLKTKQKTSTVRGSVRRQDKRKRVLASSSSRAPVCACVQVFELSHSRILKRPWFEKFCDDAISELSGKCTVDCSWNWRQELGERRGFVFSTNGTWVVTTAHVGWMPKSQMVKWAAKSEVISFLPLHHSKKKILAPTICHFLANHFLQTTCYEEVGYRCNFYKDSQCAFVLLQAFHTDDFFSKNHNKDFFHKKSAG